MDCADMWKLPVIEFLYGGYWLEFSPEDYMIEDDGVSGSCFLCILKETESPNEALLGNGFLRGFYSTHDLETNRFGFAPHATSNKADPRPGQLPKIWLEGTNRRVKVIVWVVVISSLGAISIGIAIYICASS